MEIILNELIMGVAGLLIAAVTAAIGALVPTLRKYLGEANADKAREYLTNAVEKGIAYGARKVEDKAPTITVKNEMAGFAINYVLSNVPGALEKLGITEEGVARMVEARLGLIDVIDVSKDKKVLANTTFASRDIFGPAASVTNVTNTTKK